MFGRITATDTIFGSTAGAYLASGRAVYENSELSGLFRDSQFGHACQGMKKESSRRIPRSSDLEPTLHKASLGRELQRSAILCYVGA